MKGSSTAAIAALALAPCVTAWGSLGHMTTTYIASHFVSNSTEAFFKTLLQNDGPDYLASVATWADAIRYTRWGRFTSTFHFIDAHDNPPESCNVDFERDCKETGCVITALSNYTDQLLDTTLPPWRRAQAAKFVVHFVGDLHQPLHNEDVAKGGNGIRVLWDGRGFNLHHVWDSSIAEKWIGGMHGKPLDVAAKWANQLTVEITDGKYAEESKSWLKDLDFQNSTETALAWSREGNALVCTHVLPEGPKAIVGQELGGEYFENAGPVIEKQVARGGYRLAAWLDEIVNAYQADAFLGEIPDEL